ncbi:MAG: Nucleotidyltransferase domain protein [Chloroflexi bacterium ADurb.Bin325]|nr:MAG: Nucleotidyltransferase domain protein [Chloroflexi bacterium ADurb.Bin325]
MPERQLAEFCRANGIRSLALFGSVLRADFRPDSDIDVLVEFDPTIHMGLLEYGRIRRELEAIFDREIDLVPKNSLKPRIRDSVIADSEVIYAR